MPPRRVYGNSFVGRVALVRPDDHLLDGGSEFYIGETYAVVDGINVFSWATPVASAFYRGTEHHDLCSEVAAIRVFSHDSTQIWNRLRLHRLDPLYILRGPDRQIVAHADLFAYEAELLQRA